MPCTQFSQHSPFKYQDSLNNPLQATVSTRVPSTGTCSPPPISLQNKSMNTAGDSQNFPITLAKLQKQATRVKREALLQGARSRSGREPALPTPQVSSETRPPRPRWHFPCNKHQILSKGEEYSSFHNPSLETKKFHMGSEKNGAFLYSKILLLPGWKK